MPLIETDINIQDHNRDPIMLVDEQSSTDYYVGTSNNFSDQSRPSWRIKRIWKVGSVWMFGFPDGDQGFKFIWDQRFFYTFRE